VVGRSAQNGRNGGAFPEKYCGYFSFEAAVDSAARGCLGVGNLTTLPGLILALEWPRERFSSLVGLVVGINQFTFAFGPSLVGVVRDWAGAYGPALAACTVLQAVAAVMILLGPPRPRPAHLDRGEPGPVC
jgi:hypothetical protein